MPKYPKFFRADEDQEPSDKQSPSPNEWFGHGRTKFRSSPAFSYDEDADDAEGWRGFYHIHMRDPLKNELLNDEDKGNSLKFKDTKNDPRRLVFVLENAAEIFEAGGHVDLAAECERLCELAMMEKKDD